MAPDLIPHGVDVLQYADNTIICLEHDLDRAVNLKLLLYMFEMMPGLKVNFQRSEILTVGVMKLLLKSMLSSLIVILVVSLSSTLGCL